MNFPEGKFLLMDAVEMDFADDSFEQIICVEAAFYSCPAIISQRLESRIISKEPLENTEEESKII